MYLAECANGVAAEKTWNALTFCITDTQKII